MSDFNDIESNIGSMIDEDKYMKAKVLAEDTDKHKPTPAPLLECLKKLKLQPDEVIYIISFKECSH